MLDHNLRARSNVQDIPGYINGKIFMEYSWNILHVRPDPKGFFKLLKNTGILTNFCEFAQYFEGWSKLINLMYSQNTG